MFRQKLCKKDKKFYCEKCNYRTDIASCYKQHLETTLHKTGKRKERCDKYSNAKNIKQKNNKAHTISNKYKPKFKKSLIHLSNIA